MLKERMRRYKIIEKHMEFTRTGHYEEAHALLYLLRKGKISVGLGNSSFTVECFLEKIGCPVSYSWRYYIAVFRI